MQNLQSKPKRINIVLLKRACSKRCWDCDIACARKLSKDLVYLEFNVSNAWDWNPECQHKANHRGTRLVSNTVDRGAVFSAEVTGIARVFLLFACHLLFKTFQLKYKTSILPRHWRIRITETVAISGVQSAQRQPLPQKNTLNQINLTRTIILYSKTE